MGSAEKIGHRVFGIKPRRRPSELVVGDFDATHVPSSLWVNFDDGHEKMTVGDVLQTHRDLVEETQGLHGNQT